MGEPCSRCGAVWGGPPGEVCDLCRSLGRLVGCVQEAPVNPSLRHALLVRVRTWTGETQDLIDRCREAEGRALLSSKTGSGLQPPGGLAPYTGLSPRHREGSPLSQKREGLEESEQAHHQGKRSPEETKAPTREERTGQKRRRVRDTRI